MSFIYVCAFFFFLKNKINHSVLKDLLDPIKELYEDVRRKALMRLEYEGLHKSEAITMSGARFHNNPAGFAMNRYAYYVCFKCKKVRSSCHSVPMRFLFCIVFANLQWNTNVFQESSCYIVAEETFRRKKAFLLLHKDNNWV